MNGARDLFGRPLTDLRVSVTDRCNFRCTFCMPAENRYSFLPRPEILSFEEVTRLVGIFTAFGVHKVRLTGGEPLLRAQIEELVAQLADLPGVDDLALTTNALLLREKAPALAAAGLGRVTVSLHSLDPAVFSRLSGVGIDLDRVLDGIAAARAAGLGPIKLNTVVMRGVNDGEVVRLARFAREQGDIARFIEYMDVGTVNRWDPDAVVSAAEIVDRIGARWPLEAMPSAAPGDVARRFRYLDGGGEIGVIPSVTEPFCGDCSRARLAADGRLYTCLFAAAGQDLKAALRGGASDEQLSALVARIWAGRRDRYSEERGAALAAGDFVPADKVEMFRIGG